MGETYGAELCVRAVPRDWLVLERIASVDRPSTTELVMHGWAQPDQTDERNRQPLADAWNRVVAEGVDWVDIHENADGTVGVTVVDATASYGIAQWCDDGPGLDELLMAAGLTFQMSDDGKWDMPGEARWWRPGLTQVACAAHAGQAGIVIARSDVIAIICAHSQDPVAIVAEVRKRMDIADEELEAARAEPVCG